MIECVPNFSEGRDAQRVRSFGDGIAVGEGGEGVGRGGRGEVEGGPPDIGDIGSHPTAGASVVGARGFLIAFNVNLATDDVGVAQNVARKIRESSGGFRFVKAMGRYLASRGCAQVSMNLTNFAETPLDRVFDAIREEVEVRSSQLIGFVPRKASE